MFTINNGKESVKTKYFGNTPQSNDGIEYESTKYSYDDKRLADGITIVQATLLQHPTSVQTTRPKNKNKPLCQQQVYQIPTWGIYEKYYSLTITRDNMIPHNVTILWKFLKFVEICGTMHPEGAPRSNVSRHGLFSSLMTQVWHLHLQIKASIMRECENISGTSGILYF